MISTLRSKYNLMKHQNKSDREIAIALALDYGLAKVNGFLGKHGGHFVKKVVKPTTPQQGAVLDLGYMAAHDKTKYRIKKNTNSEQE